MRTELAGQRLRVIVGAAIISRGRVLACARSDPPEVAGRWEFPGGKVEPGETEVQALVRECDEELGVRVEVGDRVGRDVPLGHGRAVLRVYAARLVDGDRPRALEHSELRWLTAGELDSVLWLPADAPIVAALPPLLTPTPPAPARPASAPPAAPTSPPAAPTPPPVPAPSAIAMSRESPSPHRLDGATSENLS